MKNIDKRHIVRKAQIAGEELAALELALLYQSRTSCILHKDTTCKKIKLRYDEYINSAKALMTKDQCSLFDKEVERLEPLCKSTAESIFNACHNAISNEGDKIKILNCSKAFNGGIGQKEDLEIEVTPKLGGDIIKTLFSIKQYDKLSDIQVASGTYASTLAGLAFENIGRGKFRAPCGEEFTSKQADSHKSLEVYRKYYGNSILEYVQDMWDAQESLSQYKKVPVFKGKEWWKSICTTTASKYIPSFIAALSIINEKDPEGFRSRFVDRCGLTGSDEIVYTAYKGKSVVTFNTLSDDIFRDFVKKLSGNTRCVTKRHGQGVNVSINDVNGESLLIVDIPLTVNRNGAWVMDPAGRWCKKSNAHFAHHQLRPEKAKEMATSTNAWVKIMAAVFNPILEARKVSE